MTYQVENHTRAVCTIQTPNHFKNDIYNNKIIKKTCRHIHANMEIVSTLPCFLSSPRWTCNNHSTEIGGTVKFRTVVQKSWELGSLSSILFSLRIYLDSSTLLMFEILPYTVDLWGACSKTFHSPIEVPQKWPCSHSCHPLCLKILKNKTAPSEDSCKGKNADPGWT